MWRPIIDYVDKLLKGEHFGPTLGTVNRNQKMSEGGSTITMGEEPTEFSSKDNGKQGEMNAVEKADKIGDMNERERDTRSKKCLMGMVLAETEEKSLMTRDKEKDNEANKRPNSNGILNAFIDGMHKYHSAA